MFGDQLLVFCGDMYGLCYCLDMSIQVSQKEDSETCYYDE